MWKCQCINWYNIAILIQKHLDVYGNRRWHSWFFYLVIVLLLIKKNVKKGKKDADGTKILK